MPSVGKTKHEIELRKQRALALYSEQLKNSSLNYQEIADEVGLASRGAAYNLVHRSLKRQISEDAAEIRQFYLRETEDSLAALDTLQNSASDPEEIRENIKLKIKVLEHYLKIIPDLKVSEKREIGFSAEEQQKALEWLDAKIEAMDARGCDSE